MNDESFKLDVISGLRFIIGIMSVMLGTLIVLTVHVLNHLR